ncbi:cellulose biosynthesis cyclic di-GMP-binding regulatory protein BcsB [Xanthobacter sp. V4C-4]|uniref:hypothetical protein n=1 Tax=Xanthobacter cornucopiae TaxID=3119924 RepID=UPI003727CA00
MTLLGSPVFAQSADPIASALQERIQDRLITREITLTDLGVDAPVVFQGMDARRDVYIPVPAGVPLSNPRFVVNADYLRGDGGRTTMVVAVDGNPIFSRSLDGEKGTVNTTVDVPGTPRPTGFMRFGVAWASVVSEDLCADERAIGNVLKLMPSSRFIYSYDASHVRDLSTAWSAMPGSGSMLVAGGALAKESFDTAWRLGLAVETAGKRIVVKTLPSIGDEVDVSGLDVPAALRVVAPFSNFVGANTYRIRDLAEVGALLLLPSSPVGADIVVADPNLLSQVRSALEALSARLGSPTMGLFNEWRSKAASLGNAVVATDELSLQTLAGRPVIAVGAGAGAKAAQLFDSFWRGTIAAGNVTIRSVDAQPAPRDSIPLSTFGNAAGNLDVLARGDWTVNFDLASATAGASLPSRLNLDVAAAPGAATTDPVVSVFLNDVLLAAKRLDANGHPEHLSAAIPVYALGARNVLRVSFQRQPVSDRCRETPQAFPVQVLPSSNLELGGSVSGADFLGVISAMSGGGRVVVPDTYLSTARSSVVRVVRAAAAAGVPSGSSSTLDVTPPGVPFRVTGSFLALDVPAQGADLKARVEGDRVIVGNNDAARILDVTGLKNVALVQAVRADGSRGILWQSIGPTPMTPQKPVRLSRGDVAIVGVDGTLIELSASGAEAGTIRVPETEGAVATLQRLWQNSAEWGLPLGVGAAALFFLLLMRASYVRRRGN